MIWFNNKQVIIITYQQEFKKIIYNAFNPYLYLII